MSKDKFEELARRLAVRNAELDAAQKPAAQLRVVRPVSTGRMDALTRESHCKMIRHIWRRWGSPMQQIIDQATFGLAGIEQLGDEGLVQLHMDMERAQDCMREGVSFEDAGLIRSHYG